MKSGSELLYLPAEVTLFDAILDSGNVRGYTVTDKPVNVLLLEYEHTSYYKVLHEGKKWYVRKSDTVRGG